MCNTCVALLARRHAGNGQQTYFATTDMTQRMSGDKGSLGRDTMISGWEESTMLGTWQNGIRCVCCEIKLR